jgi:uncharacterized Fe-S cluster protein YjdI
MSEVIKRYKNDDITVVWQPAKCIHSKKCAHDLPQVFNPENRPWIQLEGTKTDKIIAQVKACPSGALSLEGEVNADSPASTKITVTQGGPLLIEGNLSLTLANGEQASKEGTTALCRCGASANKPYCDGSHNNIDFDG